MGYVMDFRNPDFLWATVDIAIWSDIEQGLAITAGSLATLRPLWRQISDKFGLASTSFGASKPTGMRTPQPWNGAPTNDSRKKPSIFSLTKSLLQTEKNMTVKDTQDDYGMGNLAPIRLRDDLSVESEREKSDKVFNSWRIQGGSGKMSDEESRVGEIIMETHINQKNERY
jgi:hypothetical protein